MIRLQRILFPTDFSACAEGAFTHAAYLAAHFEAELHVLHAVADESAPARDWPDASGTGSLQISLADVYEDLQIPLPPPPEDHDSHDSVEVIETEVVGRAVPEVVLGYVDDEDVDLVVMGTHGRRGLRRMLMGSVAAEVVRLAPCPVFTVGGREAGERGWAIRRIVAPVDFSDHSVLAARHAAALVQAYDADLTLFHVVDAATVPTGGTPTLGPVRVSANEVQTRSQKTLERLAADLRAEFPAVGDVRAFVGVGRPASDIVDFAEEHDADLVVVGSHGRTGMKRLLMGSVAEQVVRSAPCPVFTVKSFGRTLLPTARSEDVEPAAEA
ncbi:MAG: universal stress protein [Rhodothermales bacterium]